MPVVKVEAQLSTSDLLEAVNQMNLAEMERFATQVLALRARRRAPGLSRTESELLAKISEGLPSDAQKRLDSLVDKRQAEALTPKEHQELIHLTEQLEKAQVVRVEALAQLATLRGVSLTALMQDLGIPSPDHA
jgi:hypothetical protein